MHADRRAGSSAVAVTAVLWGTTGTAATFADGVGPLAIGAAALGIGGLLQAVIAIGPLRRAWPALRARAGLVLLGGLAVAVYPLAFYSSMQLAGVAIGSVVSLASAPLAAGVLERVVDRRPLGAWWMAAAALGVLGSIALCIPGSPTDSPTHGGPTHGSSTLDLVTGIVLGLVAGVTYAVYSWVSHRLMRAGVGRAASMGSVFGVGGLLLAPVLVVTGAPLVATWTNAGVGIYIALVPMFLGYVLFGYGLSSVTPSTATTITLIEPAVATVLAVLVVHERLGLLAWVGLGLIGTVLVVLAVAPAGPAAGREARGGLATRLPSDH